MNAFMDKDFLLDTPTARTLYHEGLRDVPILDYHCHLSPKEIYENNPPRDITALWLAGDHYKWRAMRTCGIPERLITGDAAGEAKFTAFASALSLAFGNPLYHWAHLELQQYFGICEPLNEASASDIYRRANEIIRQGDFRPRSLIQNSNVTALCTTDDPADDLQYHQMLKAEGFAVKVLPTFRPERALAICKTEFHGYLLTLGQAAGVNIVDLATLKTALAVRVSYFHENGCRVSDQSFSFVPFAPADNAAADAVFKKAMAGQRVTPPEEEQYITAMMLFLGQLYAAHGWVMELHMGALRNNNSRQLAALGADTGFDSMDDLPVAQPLSRFLDALERENALPKTILFNLNPKDTAPLCAMLGNFQGEGVRGKLQYGPAWWFLDTMDGMTRQLKTLGELGVLGTFVGMETDSRAFTSYPRHAYFRRILCRLLGRWAEEGGIDADFTRLASFARGIAYDNAVAYFNL